MRVEARTIPPIMDEATTSKQQIPKNISGDISLAFQFAKAIWDCGKTGRKKETVSSTICGIHGHSILKSDSTRAGNGSLKVDAIECTKFATVLMLLRVTEGT